MTHRTLVATLAALTLAASACGGSDAAPTAAEPTATNNVEGAAGTDTPPAGISVVSPQVAASTIEAESDDLVILDVRTPEEFAEGHIDGAIMIDFYRDDFAAELAKLDRDTSYVLYCRSGNRSSEARAIMDELGFASVQDVDGGIINWQQVGLPVVTD